MMPVAYFRAVHAVLPPTLESVRPRHGKIALRCTMSGCTECARFETEYRAVFEDRLGMAVVEWDCTRQRPRDLALAAGVDQLPAYIVLSADDPQPRVVRP